MTVDRKAYARALGKLRRDAEALLPAAEQLRNDKSLHRLIAAITDAQIDFRLSGP